MKRLFVTPVLFVVCLFSFVNCQKPDNFTMESEVLSEGKGVELLEIAYRDYSNYELDTVKSMLLARMQEFEIITLGLGEDWVNVGCYALNSAFEEFLVTEIFPKYKSGVVRIHLLPEDVEFRLT